MSDTKIDVKELAEQGNAAAPAIILEMFTDATLEKEKRDLEKKIAEEEASIKEDRDKIDRIRRVEDEISKRDMQEVSDMLDRVNPAPQASERSGIALAKGYMAGLRNTARISKIEACTESANSRLAKYREQLAVINALLQKPPARRMEEHYQKLIYAMRSASTELELQKIAKQFREMGGYEDANDWAERCERGENNQRWKALGLCQYCGNCLRGLLFKRCSSCGKRNKEKDADLSIPIICCMVIIMVLVYVFFLRDSAKLPLMSGPVSVPISNNNVEHGIFTDPRDDQEYRTVVIGGKKWMAQNLNHQTDGSWCYNNDNFNCIRYGRLYTWDAAVSACPTGWRLSTREDWNNLIMAAGGDGIAGEKLKSKTEWSERQCGGSRNCNGTDDYGFSALPGGSRTSDGGFHVVGSHGYWWCVTKNDVGVRLMSSVGARVSAVSGAKSDDAFSVRCVYDMHQ